jgi:CHAT domain-containing protein/tetratricopeptide (TPR) repeat protein
MRPALWIAITVIAFTPGRAFAQAPPPTPQAAPRPYVRLYPNVAPLVPAAPRAVVPGAVWDSLRAWDLGIRAAVMESVATLWLEPVERGSAPDSLELSRLLFYQAMGRLKQRKFADGIGFARLDRALGIRMRHAPSNDLLHAWGHVYAGVAYADAAQPDGVIAHTAAAESLLLLLVPPDTTLRSTNWMNRANGLSALGRNDEARAAFERAIHLRESMVGESSYYLIPMIAEYGLFLSRSADFDEARRLLRRAVQIGANTPGTNTDYLEGALQRLSTVEDQAGNVGESLELAQRAWELARRRVGESGLAATRMQNTVAYRLEELGDVQGAATQLEAVVPLMVAQLGPTNSQTINARLALAHDQLVLGDTTMAVEQLTALRSAMAAQARFSNSNTASFRRLEVSVIRARGNEAVARESLAVAVAGEWQRRDPRATNLTYFLMQQMVGAQTPADRAYVEQVGRDVARARDSTRIRGTPGWEELIGAYAAAEARVGMREVAWRDALEAERLSRERFVYQLQALPDERALQLGQQLGRSSDLLVRIARPDQPSDLSEAWERVIQWRGRVRHEVARRRAPAAATGDTALTFAHQRWILAQRRLGQVVVSGAANADDPETAEDFHAAQRDAEAAESRYRQLAGSHLAPDPPVSLAAVIERLQPGQALVAFAIGEREAPLGPDQPDDATFGAFVATAADRTPKWVSCGTPVAVEAEVAAWMERMARPPSSASVAAKEEKACRDLGQHVRTRVWAPVLAAAGAGAREILLVPEGPVVNVPWHALPEASGRYLAEGSIAVRVIEAERDLLTPAVATSGSGLLAVGDPAYDWVAESPQPVTSRGISLRARSWPCAGGAPAAMTPLPATRAEVNGIARSWPAPEGEAKLLLGGDATEENLKKDAYGKRVIHIATHGVVVRDTCHASSSVATRGVGGIEPVATSASAPAPKKAKREAKPSAAKISAAPASAPEPARANTTRWLGRQVWLALAGADHPPADAGQENEGLLTAEEVVTLDLRGVRWVVLSACQSGLGTAWSREGVAGMRRAFHLAGAQAVIASQWPVADESTREWMEALYAARTPEIRATEASSQACRSVLKARRSSKRPTHPFYWAAFTASGE